MRRRNDCWHGDDRIRKGEATIRHSRSNEHTDATMGSSHAEPRVLPYGAWLTDARLSSFGFSAQDIRAIRRGEPVGRVLRSQAPTRLSRN
jgi:hypothetical protein